MLSTEVKLRVMEKEDLPFLHKLTNNIDIMSFWFEEAHTAMVTLEKMYEKNIETKASRSFILEKNGDQLGFVTLFQMDLIHRKAEFAIMMDPKHQGHGYASIATKLAMDYAFSVLNLHKLYLIVDQVNEKAIHIYEKMGFQEEAVLKEEYFINGTYHNIVIMSIFQRDFVKLGQ